MPKNQISRTSTGATHVEQGPANAKLCEQCGAVNSFKRVKCEQCHALLPEGKFERSRRMREQVKRRERQLALTSNLFRDKPLVPEDLDDLGDADPVMKAAAKANRDSVRKSGAATRKHTRKATAARKQSSNGK